MSPKRSVLRNKEFLNFGFICGMAACVFLIVDGILSAEWWLIAAGVVMPVLAVANGLRRIKRERPPMTWSDALRESSAIRPAYSEILKKRPLLALATKGEFRHHFVEVFADERDEDWIFRISLVDKNGRHARTVQRGMSDDADGLRYLPQNLETDATWYSKFES